MRALITRLLADERARFLLVGGINTLLGYALFVLFQVSVGSIVGYFGSLYFSYAIAILMAFLLHRGFTFRRNGSGSALLDFLRFVSVYVVSLAINTAVLPLLVEVGGLSPLLAQAIAVIVTTVLSYFGHKLFSFRRKSDPDPEPESNPES